MPGRIQKFFTLVGLLKYGIVLSGLMIFLPLTALDGVPGHDIAGNMFVELSWRGVFITTMFLLAVAWSIMVTEGLIVNGSENRFNRDVPAYRRMAEIRDIKARPPQDKHIPQWADVFFAIPVTGWQFVWFTILLGGPSFVIIVWRAEQPILALFLALPAFVIGYFVFILLCTPAALLDEDDPPLNGFPLAETTWSWFGYRSGKAAAPTRAYRFSVWLRGYITTFVKKIGLSYLIDDKAHPPLVYPIHFLAITMAIGLFVFWTIFGWATYPGRILEVESAPVVYIYASLLLFVWLFAGLNFHLGRLHISSIAALLIFVLVGYQFFSVDHEYRVTREGPKPPRLTPVDAAKASQGGQNLVVVASAGGGIWAAGWTGLALEKLIANRRDLAREIRLLSTVSGGSVGAAYYVQGLLNDEAYRKGDAVARDTLRDVRVKSVSSSLAGAAYGLAFHDFPRLITGGWYNPRLDRGDFLEGEWARIAAGTVAVSVENGVAREYLAAKGSEAAGKCWEGQNKCRFLDLREGIAAGAVPAVIFNATVMELGRKVMVTPLDFDPNVKGRERGETLAEFLFPDSKTDGSAQANLPLWTTARLSATFSFVSPAVRTKVTNKKDGEARSAWEKHIVDGGYYDNFGVASALDWLQAVLEARRDGKEGLDFSRVLIIQLRGFAEMPEVKVPPSPGAKAALIGPLDALFAIREGVAISRNRIDVDRFVSDWNKKFAGKVKLESVEFVPGIEEKPGPLSWHLSKADIKNLKESWGAGDAPAGWKPGIRESWCKLARFLGHAVGNECPASQAAP
jgi:hypothetical protein